MYKIHLFNPQIEGISLRSITVITKIHVAKVLIRPEPCLICLCDTYSMICPVAVISSSTNYHHQSGIYPEKGIRVTSRIYCSRTKYGKIKKCIHRKIPCVVPRSFSVFVLHIRDLNFNPSVRNASMNNVA